MEGFILLGLAIWLGFALRSCLRHKGGCGGDCAHCGGCGK
ncbi:MAG: FeoB-associated Cys-rich membrane protein [Oscillibacter sp.]